MRTIETMDRHEIVLKLVNKKIAKLRKKVGPKLADKYERVSRTKLEIEACERLGVDYFDYCDFLNTKK